MENNNKKNNISVSVPIKYIKEMDEREINKSKLVTQLLKVYFSEPEETRDEKIKRIIDYLDKKSLEEMVEENEITE